MGIVFEDRRLDAEQPWRRIDEWEQSILERHLAVAFEGVKSLRSLPEWPRVRTLDECGCLEFEGHGDDSTYIVVEGFGPAHPTGEPFETLLSLDSKGRLFYLEFIRYGGPGDFRPSADLLSVAPFSP